MLQVRSVWTRYSARFLPGITTVKRGLVAKGPLMPDALLPLCGREDRTVVEVWRIVGVLEKLYEEVERVGRVQAHEGDLGHRLAQRLHDERKGHHRRRKHVQTQARQHVE